MANIFVSKGLSTLVPGGAIVNVVACALLAIDYEPPHAGSFIPAILRLATTLRHHGLEPVIVVPKVSYDQPWVKPFATANIEILRTFRYGEIARIFVERSPLVAHALFSGYVVPLTLAALATRSRVIWHIFSALPTRVSWLKRASRVAKFCLLSRRANAILAVSSGLRDDLIALGAPRERVHIVGNAIDTVHFRESSSDERQCARRDLGIEDDRKVILFFGRDAYIKGADFLSAALRAIYEPVTLICIATPPEVLALMPAHVRVISTGIVTDTRPLYWAADLLVMPSRMEGASAPLALLEGRATGLPALLSSIPGFESYAQTDPGVRTIDPIDADAFEAALRQPCHSRMIDAGIRAQIALDAWCSSVIARYDLPAA